MNSEAQGGVTVNDDRQATATEAIIGLAQIAEYRRDQGKHLEALEAATFIANRARELADELAEEARTRGSSWSEIGRAANMTRQAAQQRWGAARTEKPQQNETLDLEQPATEQPATEQPATEHQALEVEDQALEVEDQALEVTNGNMPPMHVVVAVVQNFEGKWRVSCPVCTFVMHENTRSAGRKIAKHHQETHARGTVQIARSKEYRQ